MRIEIGAETRTKEGKDIGKVHKVIIDPNQNKITHVVVGTGFLFGRLVVIPMEAVRRANQHGLLLRINEEEVGEMPDFVETQYAAPPQGWAPPLGLPPGGILWPGGYIYMPMVVEQEERVPKGSIGVNKGTEVFALDGRIGVVSEVVVDSEGSSITGFVVAKSRQLPFSVFIPTNWIAAAGGGRLSLNRTKDEVIAHGKLDDAA